MTAPISRMLDAVEWEVLPPQEPSDGLPVATHAGILTIAGYPFRVFQLSNGQRVFDADDLAQFFAGALP